MKAQELRIGNLVYDGGNYPENIITLSMADFYNMYLDDKCYFESIPITEDWMVRFRFIEMGVYFEKYNCKFGFCFEDGELDVWIKNQDQEDCYICSVSYVHQFQNIYFSLTGEELTIT